MEQFLGHSEYMLEQKVVVQSTKVVNYKQSKIKVMRVGLFPFAMNQGGIFMAAAFGWTMQGSILPTSNLLDWDGKENNGVPEADMIQSHNIICSSIARTF
jgi:hypothetical protein